MEIQPSEVPEAAQSSSAVQSNNLSKLIRTAVTCEDQKLFDSILTMGRDSSAVLQAVKALPIAHCVSFLTLAVHKLLRCPGDVTILAPWIRQILFLHQQSMLTEVPESAEVIGLLREHLTVRLRDYDALLRLQGRIDALVHTNTYAVQKTALVEAVAAMGVEVFVPSTDEQKFEVKEYVKT